LQRCEQVVRINDSVRIRHISHALFFDQVPLAGQQPQHARDDLAEQRLQLLARERGRWVEYWRPFRAGAIDTIEHQAMQVYVQKRSDRKKINPAGERPPERKRAHARMQAPAHVRMLAVCSYCRRLSGRAAGFWCVS